MKSFVCFAVVLGFASCVKVTEDTKRTSPLNTTNISNSTDEEHSETLHIPAYAIADGGLLLKAPDQYVALRPETPVYHSVYALKSPPSHSNEAHYADNYIDHEYNSILGLSRNIPGIPGTDYPLYAAIPYTGFSCHQIGFPGFYADVLARCQVWHYCQPDGRHDAFLCPNGTIFDQKNRVCNWWYNVRCEDSQYWYAINDDLYRIPKKKYILAPYYDHYYSPSKIIETRTKPPVTEKPRDNKSLKFHPAIIVKMPKQTYQYLKNEKLQQQASETNTKAIRLPKKEAVAKSNPKI